jgi:hypothetical protein
LVFSPGTLDPVVDAEAQPSATFAERQVGIDCRVKPGNEVHEQIRRNSD